MVPHTHYVQKIPTAFISTTRWVICVAKRTDANMCDNTFLLMHAYQLPMFMCTWCSSVDLHLCLCLWRRKRHDSLCKNDDMLPKTFKIICRSFLTHTLIIKSFVYDIHFWLYRSPLYLMSWYSSSFSSFSIKVIRSYSSCIKTSQYT